MAENQETANQTRDVAPDDEGGKPGSAGGKLGGAGVTPDNQDSSVATKPMPEAARRALAEAEARRKAAHNEQMAEEIGGRKEGPDPTRYGDWENKGILSDF